LHYNDRKKITLIVTWLCLHGSFFTLSKADESGIVESPVKQTSVENGAAPDIELFKKLIRSKKGENAFLIRFQTE